MKVLKNLLDVEIAINGLNQNYRNDRVGQENKKPSVIPEGQNTTDSAMFTKPPEPERCESTHILSGSSNLCKQKGDQMTEKLKFQKQDSQYIQSPRVLGGVS
jgi:hypothetical protein